MAELWEAYSRHGEASGYAFAVFRQADGTVLGYACYGPHPLTEGTYDLYWIVVDPQARGQGIGRALLEHVEDQARSTGARLLVAETSSSSAYEPARRLYASRGYAREAVLVDFYAPGDDLLIYTKPLSSQGQDAAGRRAALRPYVDSRPLCVH